MRKTAVNKLAIGETLAKAKIKAYVASAKHTSMSKTHSYRFAIYKALIKATVSGALGDFDDLVINIGRQGGSQKYASDLIKELQSLPDDFIKTNRQFRKTKFFLLSASNAAIQLADFYASASRDYILSKFTHVSATPYNKVAHQVILLPEIQTVSILKEG